MSTETTNIYYGGVGRGADNFVLQFSPRSLTDTTIDVKVRNLNDASNTNGEIVEIRVKE